MCSFRRGTTLLLKGFQCYIMLYLVPETCFGSAAVRFFPVLHITCGFLYSSSRWADGGSIVVESIIHFIHFPQYQSDYRGNLLANLVNATSCLCARDEQDHNVEVCNYCPESPSSSRTTSTTFFNMFQIN